MLESSEGELSAFENLLFESVCSPRSILSRVPAGLGTFLCMDSSNMTLAARHVSPKGAYPLEDEKATVRGEGLAFVCSIKAGKKRWIM